GVVEAAAGFVQPGDERGGDARTPQGERLLEGGGAQARGSPGQGRGRDGCGSVSVAVGLDDADDVHAGERAQMADVVGDGPQVDGGFAERVAAHATSVLSAMT